MQTVTSSVVYSSGSNVFGNDIGNSQVFTGSVLITGSLTIAGASSATSYSGTTIYGSTAVCSAVGKFSTCLDLGGALTGTSATFSSCVTATQFNVSTSGGTTQIYNTGGGHTVITNATANKDMNIQTSGTGAQYFNTAGADRLTIASTGIACFACQVCAPNLLISNCINIGTTVSLGSRLSIQSANDQAGITMYNSYDCNKWSLRTGTVGVSNKGFAIVDDICNATRIQINGAGNVGIGTSVPDAKLHICNAVAGGTNNYLIIVQNACTVADARAGIAFSNNSQTPSAGGLSGASIQTSNNGIDGAGNLLFSTLISGTNCERMRITSAGDVAINDTTANTYAKLQVTATSGATLALANPSAAAASVGSSIWFYGTTGYNTQGVIQTGYDGTSNVYAYMAFSTRGGSTTERMRITSAGITCFGFTVCAPCFATISDYRMKSNVRPIEGLSIIMKTKPYKFEYNYDCSTSFGMIAHELQDTLPEAVFGQKDGEVMQGVDYMKLLPIAIKAIQELKAENDIFKTCLGIS